MQVVSTALRVNLASDVLKLTLLATSKEALWALYAGVQDMLQQVDHFSGKCDLTYPTSWPLVSI